MDDFLSEIRDAAALMVGGSESYNGDRVRYAKVTAVTYAAAGSKVSVLMGGATITNVPVLSSYNPLVDDNAMLVQSPGGRLIAIGATNQGAGWQTPSFASPWANFDTVNWTGARYRREGDLVRIEGLVKTTSNITPPNVTIFTLPVGYRPPKYVLFASWSSDGDNSPARIQVSAAGEVQMTYQWISTVSTTPQALNKTGAHTVGFLSINCCFSIN